MFEMPRKRKTSKQDGQAPSNIADSKHVGLLNPISAGNCYVNAVMQLLFACMSIRSAVTSVRWENLVRALAKMSLTN